MTDITTHFPVGDADLARLTDHLATEASGENLLDAAYRTLSTPIGPLMIAATPVGLVRVAFDREPADEVLTGLADRLGPRILEARHDHALLDAVASQLTEYFAGTRREFDLPLDFTMSAASGNSGKTATRTTFRQTVQRYLPRIGYGHTSTYKEVAEALDNPKAVRAVGTACATNPIPVVVPCHRVLRTDGGLGGYRGGLEAKTVLLDLEHAA